MRYDTKIHSTTQEDASVLQKMKAGDLRNAVNSRIIGLRH